MPQPLPKIPIGFGIFNRNFWQGQSLFWMSFSHPCLKFTFEILRHSHLFQTKHLSPWSGVDYLGNTHYWLQDEITGEIIDLTVSQYDQLSYDPPYVTGKKRKWYGFRPFPQMRTLDLIQKIQPDAKRSKVPTLETLVG